MDEKNKIVSDESNINQLNKNFQETDASEPDPVIEEYTDTDSASVLDKPVQKAEKVAKAPAPAKSVSKSASKSTPAPVKSAAKPTTKTPTPTPKMSRKPEQKKAPVPRSARRTTMKHSKSVHTVEKKSKSEKKSHMWLWVVLGVIVVVGIIVLLIFLFAKNTPVINTQETPVAAIVNSEPIYAKAIEQQYNNMNPAMQQLYSKEAILNQSITEKLLLQEAKKLNLQVTSDEIKADIDTIKKSNGLTDDAFQTILEQQNLTQKDVELIIFNQRMIMKLVNTTIIPQVVITEAQIQAYYATNTAKFKDAQKVTVQQILILVTPNVTEANAKTKIDAIKKELTASNFCDLVVKYTQDPGSKNTCGEYTFGRGVMVPEFEQASFSMKIGDVTTTKTDYGWHLIKKLNETPARTLPLTDVYDAINKTLSDGKTQELFDAVVATLHKNANITIYMYGPTVENTSTTANTVTTPAVLGTDKVVTLAKCLTEKGVLFYGAYWCTHCANQKQMFGDALIYITYVECADPDNAQTQTPECTAAGISGYPTWIINSKKYPGEQPLEKLAQLSGCSY
ncbi:MAG: peptidylprolyl isomerase [Candidatus Woesearchaeota archaeon]